MKVYIILLKKVSSSILLPVCIAYIAYCDIALAYICSQIDLKAKFFFILGNVQSPLAISSVYICNIICPKRILFVWLSLRIQFFVIVLVCVCVCIALILLFYDYKRAFSFRLIWFSLRCTSFIFIHIVC